MNPKLSKEETKTLFNIIETNKKDITRTAKFMKQIEKLHSKELAGKIQSLLVDEVLRLSEQNQKLNSYLKSQEEVK